MDNPSFRAGRAAARPGIQLGHVFLKSGVFFTKSVPYFDTEETDLGRDDASVSRALSRNYATADDEN